MVPLDLLQMLWDRGGGPRRRDTMLEFMEYTTLAAGFARHSYKLPARLCPHILLLDLCARPEHI